jgi:hypothetical protein
MTGAVGSLPPTSIPGELLSTLLERRSGSDEAIKGEAKTTLIRFADRAGVRFDEDGFERFWAAIPAALKRADASEESISRAYLELIAKSFGFASVQALQKRFAAVIPAVEAAEARPMDQLPRPGLERVGEEELSRLAQVRGQIVGRLLSLPRPSSAQIVFEIEYALLRRGPDDGPSVPLDASRIESAHQLARALAPLLEAELGLRPDNEPERDPLRFTTGADFFARESESWTRALAEARQANIAPAAKTAAQDPPGAVPAFARQEFPDPDPRHYDAQRFIAIARERATEVKLELDGRLLDPTRSLSRASGAEPLTPADLSVAQLGVRMREVYDRRESLTFAEMCEKSARICAETDTAYLARALGIPPTDGKALQRVFDVLLLASRASALALGVAFTEDGKPIPSKQKELTASLSAAGSIAYQLFPLLLHAASAKGDEALTDAEYRELLSEASRYLSQVSLESSAAITALNLNSTVYPDGNRLRELLKRVLPEDHRTYKQATTVATQETSNRLLGALYRMAHTTWKAHQLLRAVWDGKPERIDSSERNSAFNSYDLLKLDLIERTRAYEECRVRLRRIAPHLGADALKDGGLVTRAQLGELTAEDLERLHVTHKGKELAVVNRAIQADLRAVHLDFFELSEVMQLAFARGVWEVHLDAISLEKARAAADRFLKASGG